MLQCYLTTFQITYRSIIFKLYTVLMGNLHICYITKKKTKKKQKKNSYSICIERRKCILPSWPQIYKPHDVKNGCYVIFGYPSSHKIDLKCTQNSHKMPTKTPLQMHIKMPSNAHKDAPKMHTKTHIPSACIITIT